MKTGLNLNKVVISAVMLSLWSVCAHAAKVSESDLAAILKGEYEAKPSLSTKDMLESGSDSDVITQFLKLNKSARRSLREQCLATLNEAKETQTKLNPEEEAAKQATEVAKAEAELKKHQDELKIYTDKEKMVPKKEDLTVEKEEAESALTASIEAVKKHINDIISKDQVNAENTAALASIKDFIKEVETQKALVATQAQADALAGALRALQAAEQRLETAQAALTVDGVTVTAEMNNAVTTAQGEVDAAGKRFEEVTLTLPKVKAYEFAIDKDSVEKFERAIERSKSEKIWEKLNVKSNDKDLSDLVSKLSDDHGTFESKKDELASLQSCIDKAGKDEECSKVKSIRESITSTEKKIADAKKAVTDNSKTVAHLERRCKQLADLVNFGKTAEELLSEEKKDKSKEPASDKDEDKEERKSRDRESRITERPEFVAPEAAPQCVNAIPQEVLAALQSIPDLGNRMQAGLQYISTSLGGQVAALAANMTAISNAARKNQSLANQSSLDLASVDGSAKAMAVTMAKDKDAKLAAFTALQSQASDAKSKAERIKGELDNLMSQAANNEKDCAQESAALSQYMAQSQLQVSAQAMAQGQSAAMAQQMAMQMPRAPKCEEALRIQEQISVKQAEYNSALKEVAEYKSAVQIAQMDINNASKGSANGDIDANSVMANARIVQQAFQSGLTAGLQMNGASQTTSAPGTGFIQNGGATFGQTLNLTGPSKGAATTGSTVNASSGKSTGSTVKGKISSRKI